MARVFKDLEVELEHFSEPSAAVLHAAKNRFDAIVIDDSISQTGSILNKILELPSCNKSVRIVLADCDSTLNEVFKTGTQIILYKPLTLERVRHGLRAVRNLMARERRRGAKRVRAMITARLIIGKMGPREALIMDISDTGAAVQFHPGEAPASNTFNLEFTPTGDTENIHAKAEVVWQDNEGNAGIRFVDMASYSRKRLAQWLKEQPSEKKSLAAMVARSGA
jgi:hypothetical protein